MVICQGVRTQFLSIGTCRSCPHFLSALGSICKYCNCGWCFWQQFCSESASKTAISEQIMSLWTVLSYPRPWHRPSKHSAYNSIGLLTGTINNLQVFRCPILRSLWRILCTFTDENDTQFTYIIRQCCPQHQNKVCIQSNHSSNQSPSSGWLMAATPAAASKQPSPRRKKPTREQAQAAADRQRKQEQENSHKALIAEPYTC